MKKYTFLLIIIILFSLLLSPIVNANGLSENLLDVNVLDIYLGPDNVYLLKVEVTNTRGVMSDVNVALTEPSGGVAGARAGDPEDIIFLAEFVPDTGAIISNDNQEIDLLDMEPNEKRVIYVELNSFFVEGQSTIRLAGTAGLLYDNDDVDVSIE